MRLRLIGKRKTDRKRRRRRQRQKSKKKEQRLFFFSLRLILFFNLSPSFRLSRPSCILSLSLVTRLLLLLAEQRPERDAGDLDDLEADAGDVTDSVAATAETGDEDLVLFFGFGFGFDFDFSLFRKR